MEGSTLLKITKYYIEILYFSQVIDVPDSSHIEKQIKRPLSANDTWTVSSSIKNEEQQRRPSLAANFVIKPQQPLEASKGFNVPKINEQNRGISIWSGRSDRYESHQNYTYF